MARFTKGQTGNPGGRPKIPADIVEAAKAYSMTAIETLASICAESTDDGMRIKAAELLLNRAWGKPAKTVNATLKGGQGQASSVQVSFAWAEAGNPRLCRTLLATLLLPEQKKDEQGGSVENNQRKSSCSTQ